MSVKHKSPLLKENQEAKPLILQALEILETAAEKSGDIRFRFCVDKAICRLLDLVSEFDVKGWYE